MGHENLLIFADSSQGEEDPDLPSKSASRLADAGSTLISVSSIDTFVGAFTWLKAEIVDKGAKAVKNLKIVSHGSSGELSLGAEPFRYSNLFRLNGFGEVFAADASIEFFGCELAEGPVGERMTIALATTLLPAHGGTLVAHTTPVRWIPGTSVTFSFGSNVKIEVGTGGTAKAWGLTHLIPDKVRTRLGEDAGKYAKVKEKITLGMRALLEKKIARAALAVGEAPRIPTTDNLVEACERLSELEGHLDRL